MDLFGFLMPLSFRLRATHIFVGFNTQQSRLLSSLCNFRVGKIFRAQPADRPARVDRFSE